MRKKAAMEIRTLGQTVAVMGAVVIVLFIMLKSSGIVQPERREGTIKEFDELVDAVRKASEGSQGLIEMNYAIDDGWILYGFDTAALIDNCNDRNVQRPDACQGIACLCLCKEDDWECRGPQSKCVPLEGIDFFVSYDLNNEYYTTGEPHPEDPEAKSMVFYGDCGAGWHTWANRRIAIERDIGTAEGRGDVKSIAISVVG